MNAGIVGILCLVLGVGLGYGLHPMLQPQVLGAIGFDTTITFTVGNGTNIVTAKINYTSATIPQAILTPLDTYILANKKIRLQVSNQTQLTDTTGTATFTGVIAGTYKLVFEGSEILKPCSSADVVVP